MLEVRNNKNIAIDTEKIKTKKVFKVVGVLFVYFYFFQTPSKLLDMHLDMKSLL